ncbi:MAG: hypothetical protein ABI537_16665 [Casimicrobiaceae bacterium]
MRQHAGAATSAGVDEAELVALGFKVLVATSSTQADWVKTFTPGQVRPMQRNEKKYFIYPDAAKNRIFVGGPEQYEAYEALHPGEDRRAAQAAAASAYRGRQDAAMRKASGRDISDPYYGVRWADLGW